MICPSPCASITGSTAAMAEFGRIDVLVNNAGIMPLSNLNVLNMPAPNGRPS